jgi:fatty-acyl-CoA synthase
VSPAGVPTLGNILPGPARRIALEARAIGALVRAGVIGVESPHDLWRIAGALRAHGPYGATSRVGALRHGDRPAIADEQGTLTYAELDEQVNRLAHSLRTRGLGAGSTAGIMCRNSRSPLIASFAVAQLGMDAIWLNTAFSSRQATDVVKREGVELLICDEEFVEVLSDSPVTHGRLLTATDDPQNDELLRLIADGDATPVPSAGRVGRIVLLTSGTTGTPKGAPRAVRGLTIPGALLERMPMRPREATVIGPPLYHGTGLVIALLSILLGSELVLPRRFDAARLLDLSEAHRATTWCVVPAMLQRVLALGRDEIRRRDLRSLRIVFCAGSQLPAAVSSTARELLGDVIYNLYGSTEVSVATFATPKDLVAAPTSVGRPALGSRVKILDAAGRELPAGQTGRIFVGSTSPFEGYTGGGSKEIIEGLLNTGDLGHFDAEGRLYVDGREDEMIVSGGENVFPTEVEELLAQHPAVNEAAAVGVEDADFGQRLKAFVVKRDGAVVSGEELQAFVKANLARYKAPREVVFVDELPRNPTGKVLKRELVGRAT